jgi:hypothetical protein
MIILSPAFGARIHRPKRGEYRRRTDVPVGKPVKGKRRKLH